MSFSTYMADAILAWKRGTALPSVPTYFYISLHTADPGATGASEVGAGVGYARQPVSPAVGSWGAPAGGGGGRQHSNTNAIPFGTATGGWGTVTHFGIWDALSGGNFIEGGALGTPRAIVAGNTPSFAAGAIVDTVLTG